MLQRNLVDSAGNTLMRRSQRRPKSNTQPALKLERVIGFTPSSNNCISTHPTQDTLAYPSGCTTVLFDLKKHIQGPFLIGTLATASPELVTNSSAAPSVSKANPLYLHPNRSSPVNGSNFVPPKSVVAMTFSPDGKYIAVGEAGRNPRVLTWDLELKKYVSSLKGHKYGVLALAFSPDQNYLVSLGYQHDGVINVWDWKKGVRIASNRVSSKVNGLVFSSDGSYFVTVGLRHVRFWYLNQHSPLTKERSGVLEGRSGILGSFNGKVFLDGVFCNHSLYAITSDSFLCKINGTRKVEASVILQANGAISLAHCDGKLAVGCTDGTTLIYSASDMKLIVTLPKPRPLGNSNQQHPDTIAVKFNFDGTKLINLFSDRSMVLWDITHKVTKLYSVSFHSDAVWGSDFRPSSPFDSLSTCSSDGTIRFWNLDDQSQNTVLCLDPDAALRYNTAMPSTEPNPLWGIRSVKFTEDGLYILSGDRTGNLRVHEMANHKLVTYQEAHDSEIIDIDVTSDSVGYYVATGSRDRTAHVFKMSPGKFNLVQTLEEHSSSITSVNFLDQGNHLISCSADKSIIFRNNMNWVGNSAGNNSEMPHYVSSFNHCNRATFSGMVANETNGTVTAVSQDKHIHQLCARTGKLLKLLKIQDPNADVSMTRVALDTSGQYACVAGTDKGVRIVDLTSGQLIGSVYGHSEMVTSVNFSPDCSRVISTSGDGCIFVWKLNMDLLAKIRKPKRKPIQEYSTKRNISARSITRPLINQGNSKSKADTGFKNDTGQHRAFSLDQAASSPPSTSRWGRRVEKNGISIFGSSLASRSQIKLNEFQSKLIANQTQAESSETTDSCYESSVVEECENIESPNQSVYSLFSVNNNDAGYESTEKLLTDYNQSPELIFDEKETCTSNVPPPDWVLDHTNDGLPNDVLDSKIIHRIDYQEREIQNMTNQLELAQLIINELHQSYSNLKLHQLTDQDPLEKHNLYSKFHNLSSQLNIPPTAILPLLPKRVSYQN